LARVRVERQWSHRAAGNAGEEQDNKIVFLALLASWREIGLKDNDLAEIAKNAKEEQDNKIVCGEYPSIYSDAIVMQWKQRESLNAKFPKQGLITYTTTPYRPIFAIKRPLHWIFPSQLILGGLCYRK